ncbi:MAG: hypothetical protein K8I01_00065, partial [Candidatus Methylomirabilis sp.]|nr:hypothetical protein [Deltaproteobacteria bacterium]
GQGPEAGGKQAGSPVEAVSDEAELISWPEEEIAVTVEGLEEAKVNEAEIEADAAIEPVPSSVEETPDEPPAPVRADDMPSPAAGIEAGPGEVEIDIEDLLKGELPAAASEGILSEAGPGIPSEIEIEIEAAQQEEAVAPTSEADSEPEETLSSGGPFEAGSGEEEIEIDVMSEEGVEEAVSGEAAINEAPSASEEPPQEVLPETVIEAEALGNDAVEAAGEVPPVTVEALTPVEANEEYAEPAPDEAGPQAAEAPEPEVIDEEPGEAAPPHEDDGAQAAGLPRPEEQAFSDFEESQEDISSAIKELMEKIEPEAGDAAAKKEDYVDLSAELGMEEALTDLAGSWGSEEKKDTFDEFKSGIGNQLSKEDSETHYNLGIAYMEMELFFEASKEFKIALKDPRLEFNCYTRLGLCAMALSEPQEAVTYYLKGIKVEGRSIEERIGMMYELGLAYEAAGETEEAEELFKGIHELAPSFREVADKVKTNMQARSSPPPFMPLEDGLLEVELL